MDKELTFRSANLLQSSFKFFAHAREAHKFCDIEFTLGTERIAAHRVILAAAIPLFQEISSFEEEIPLSDVEPCAFQCLVNYAYSGELKITIENVRALLSGASSLRMKDVQDACCDFLTNRLHPENVLDFRDLAVDLNLLEFKKCIDFYATENFEHVSKTDKFLQTSFTYIRELFTKDDLNVNSEENVLETALNWVKASENERRSYLPELLSQVRMPLLRPLYLTDMVEREELIRTSLKCRDLVDEARNYNLFPKRRKTVSSFSTRPREFMKISKATEEFDSRIYSLKANIKYTLLHFDRVKEMWSAKATKSFCVSNGCVAVLNKKIYFFHCGYLFKYDPERDESEMSDQLTVPRYMAAAVALRNKIYVCGGYTIGGAASKAVECFDPMRNEWTQMKPMNKGRRGLCAVSHGEYIYVLGGGDTRRMYNTVERYNFITNNWQFMSSMMSPRYRAGATVLNGIIYVCGGYINLDGEEFTATAEMYDPIVNKWKSISPMNTARSLRSLVAFDGKLYAIGENDSRTTRLNSCEIYDPLTNKWTYGPSTPSSHANSAAVMM